MLTAPSTSLGQISAPEPSHLATLTEAHQAHSLTLEEAAKSYPVNLSGVVTYYDQFLDPQHPALWVPDPTGGVYVALASPPAIPYQSGDRVVIRGVSATGGYAPVIKASEVRVTGHFPLSLPATRVTFAEMLSGSSDGRWVEVEGIVQGVRQVGRHIDLDLALSDGSVMASTVHPSGFAYADLLDAKVKVRVGFGGTDGTRTLRKWKANFSTGYPFERVCENRVNTHPCFPKYRSRLTTKSDHEILTTKSSVLGSGYIPVLLPAKEKN